MNNENGFSYSYSASEQEELKRIKSKYAEGAKEDKLERLRRLDASVTRTGTVVSLVLGVVGSLVMGFGMSLIMSDLYEMMKMSQNAAIAVGVPVGIIGMVLVGLAYPAYSLTVKAKKKQLAPEILSLIDELMK